MEDAMVLNKASVERGFAHGSVYRGRVSKSQCDQKHATLHSFITLANIGRFQKFFYCWTQQEIWNIIYITLCG